MIPRTTQFERIAYERGSLTFKRGSENYEAAICQAADRTERCLRTCETDHQIRSDSQGTPGFEQGDVERGWDGERRMCSDLLVMLSSR